MIWIRDINESFLKLINLDKLLKFRILVWPKINEEKHGCGMLVLLKVWRFHTSHISLIILSKLLDPLQMEIGYFKKKIREIINYITSKILKKTNSKIQNKMKIPNLKDKSNKVDLVMSFKFKRKIKN